MSSSQYIAIKRSNGIISIVRSEVFSASEDPLSEHEEIINELVNGTSYVIRDSKNSNKEVIK